MAATFARYGFKTTLFDIKPDQIEKAKGTVEFVYTTLIRRGFATEEEASAGRANLTYTQDLKEAAGNADFIVETVPERADIKTDVFKQLDGVAKPGVVFASNTSGIPITKLGEAVSDPGRVVGMHWSNPPHLIPMIEVIPGEQTSSESVAAAVALVESLGYEAVVEKEVPGFVENRILYAIMREAVDLVDRGIIDADGMDRCVRWGIGYKLAVIGPMELLDMAGLDIYHNVGSYLNQDLCNGAEVSKTITDRVERGELGIKAGKGLYDYTPERIAELRAERARKLVAVRKALES